MTTSSSCCHSKRSLNSEQRVIRKPLKCWPELSEGKLAGERSLDRCNRLELISDARETASASTSLRDWRQRTPSYSRTWKTWHLQAKLLPSHWWTTSIPSSPRSIHSTQP